MIKVLLLTKIMISLAASVSEKDSRANNATRELTTKKSIHWTSDYNNIFVR